MTVNELINELHARTRPENRNTQVVLIDCGSKIIEVDFVIVNQADGTVRIG